MLICRQTNDPAQALWIGDRGSEADFERLASLIRRDVGESLAHSLLETSPSLSLRFLDEFYHFPPRPYQVWSLEVHVPPERQLQALKDLFELARVVRRDPRVAGISLYQALEAPGLFVGFLGLGWGSTPTSLARNGSTHLTTLERIERDVLWRPLSLVCEFKRLRTVKSLASEGDATPQLPFWARGRSDGRRSAAPSGRE